MKVAYSRVLLCVTGLLLLGWAGLLATTGSVVAAPALVITQTTSAEPPTLTPTTAVPTTAVPTTPVTSTPVTSTPVTSTPATSTPATGTPVTSTPVTSTPVPTTPTGGTPPTSTATPDEPDPEPRPSNTPPPAATATPLLTPTPAQVADPAIVKSASPTTLRVGETVEFTLNVTNLGNVAASDVVVSDTLPAFLALDGVSASRGEVSVSGATVRVLIGNLDPGETVTVRITARVVGLATPPDNANVGTVGSSSATDDPSNNSSRVDLTTQPAATPATPTVAGPVSLPNTGAPGGTDGTGGTSAVWLALLGLALIAASLLLRARRL